MDLKILRFINTIKYLKFEQIFFLVLKRIFNYQGRVGNLPWRFKSEFFKTQKELPIYYKDGKDYENGCIKFLNKKYNLYDIWLNYQDYTKLEQFNSHYFNFLDNEFDQEQVSKILDCLNIWLENRITYANDCVGHSYVRSIRVVNLIKFCLRNAICDLRIVECIQEDLTFIKKNKERDLQGNHLLENLKALYIGSNFFETHLQNSKVKNEFENFLMEASQQFLIDGAHEELSPMYHSILLAGLIEVRHFRKNYDKNTNSTEDLLKLDSIIHRAAIWLANMSHGDGFISFFNDSTLGISPSLTEIRNLLEKEEIETLKLLPTKTVFFKYSGFFIGYASDFKIIADYGEIGCHHQPGHAHADTFSFELSHSKQRIFVNSGVSNYEVCDLRNFQRSTQAHNTLTVGEVSSTDVYGSFRVGRRANILNLHTSKETINNFISASHDGFGNFRKKLLHNRKILWNKFGCDIEDELIGWKGENISIRYYLHPNLKIIKMSINKYSVKNGEEILLDLRIYDATSRVEQSKYFSGFATESNSNCLVISPNLNKSKVQLSWKN
jgi:hypothetical protein